ncbi:MAG TPA: ABC transporter permease subunit [Planctomycetota bacterium]|nr:ABC transporter permease subunit [Planctomycetota bacterium]
MPRIRPPSLPLVAKELTEQAARRRTYVLRVLYALLLVAVFAFAHHQSGRHGGEMLGRGRELFQVLVVAQMVGVLLIAPALIAGSISSEKERGSLTLLLLTRMSPGELLAQKWISGLIAVGSWVLISLPLLAIAYAYGGFSSGYLVAGAALLALTCVLATSVALAASAWCRTSAGAFVLAYLLLGGALAIGPMIDLVHGFDPYRYGGFNPRGGWAVVDGFVPDPWCLVPPALFERYDHRRSPEHVWIDCVPLLVAITAFLAFARWAFVRRASVTATNRVLRVFRHLDRWYERIDARMGRRVVTDEVPVREPIAWREFNRRSLTNWRYLVRLVLPIIAVLTLGLTAAAGTSSRALHSLFATTTLGLEVLVVLVVLVLGACLVAGERSSQTLDVLLTTPITARSIIEQKMRGMRRLWYAAWLVLGVVVGTRLILGDLTGGFHRVAWSPWFAIAGMVLLPPVFTWFATAIGLLQRNRNRAVATAIIGACAWIVLPTMAIGFTGDLIGADRDSTRCWLALTPFFQPLANEIGEVHDFDAVAPLIIYVVTHALVWYGMRAWCLGNADRLLRRTSPSA